MAQPKLSRCRRKLPPSPVRTMDLLGIGKDGGLYLWDAAAQVRPISAFERRGAGIVCGHYVLEVNGRAITAHCHNLIDGRVGVQFMCGGLPDRYLPRKYIEEMLLGQVVPDPVKAAEISRLLREINEAMDARQTARHLRRGKL